jgi:hypothetical protein
MLEALFATACSPGETGGVCVREWFAALAGPLAMTAVAVAWIQAREARRASVAAIRPILADHVSLYGSMLSELEEFDNLTGMLGLIGNAEVDLSTKARVDLLNARRDEIWNSYLRILSAFERFDRMPGLDKKLDPEVASIKKDIGVVMHALVSRESAWTTEENERAQLFSSIDTTRRSLASFASLVSAEYKQRRDRLARVDAQLE